MYSISTLLITQIGVGIAKNNPIEVIKSENHGQNTLLYEEQFKKVILDWWKNNNVPKPLQCNYKIRPSYKKTYLSKMSSPEIKSFPCQTNKTSPHYDFKGSIVNGSLEGKGRLLFMSEQDWLKLSTEKRNDAKGKNVCFTAMHLVNNQHVREIIGTFKNGSLHGTTKITFPDNSFSIGTYKKGKAHGYQRSFNRNGSLLDAVLYEKRVEDRVRMDKTFSSSIIPRQKHGSR